MSAVAVRSAPIDLQRRLSELGRIRLGEKGEKGEPRRLSTFRLTSASRELLEAAAALYGGQVRPWKGAPDEGYFELTTTSAELDILIPPTLAAYSQAYEYWQGGTAERRCDGATEVLSGEACVCAAEGGDRKCQITTRVSVMLPNLPGLGVWRLDTKGWNAAATLPSTLELLGAAAGGSWIPAVLRAVAKSKRVRLPSKKVETHRWVEPQIDLSSVTIGQLLGDRVPVAGAAIASSAPAATRARLDRGTKVERPALPAGPEPPADTSFRHEEMPAFGPAAEIAPPFPIDEAPAEPSPRGDAGRGRAGVAAPAGTTAGAPPDHEPGAAASTSRASGHTASGSRKRRGRAELPPTPPADPATGEVVDLVKELRDAAWVGDNETLADPTQRLAVKTLFERSPGVWAVAPSAMRDLTVWTFAIEDSRSLTVGMAEALLSVAQQLGKDTFLRMWTEEAVRVHNGQAA